MLPRSMQQLVQSLSRLPSVGEKTAQRFALFLATADPSIAQSLALSLEHLLATVTTCSRCGNLAEAEATESEGPLAECGICRDPKRQGGVLCVVARIQDLLSIERSRSFSGRYFVLGKLLSPLEGIGAEQLPLASLMQRIRDEDIQEVLLATPPSVDGEATALLIAQQLKNSTAKVSRIASGVPHGGDLEYADPVTIGRAIAYRRGLD